MKADDREKYIVLEHEDENLARFASKLENEIAVNYQKKNVVINLSNFNSLELSDLLLFLKISNKHRASKKSFVIVNRAINPDDIPNEMVVVPTLGEAGDIIEMEEIERDLGF